MSNFTSIQEVLIEDDNGAYVSYSPPEAWSYWRGENYHAQSYHVTQTAGASVAFVFEGSFVAYYSDKNYDHGEFDVALNGVSIFAGDSRSDSLIVQVPLFNASVPPGFHTLTITNGGNGTLMGVDYFVYHPLVPGAPPSTASQTGRSQSPAVLPSPPYSSTDSGGQVYTTLVTGSRDNRDAATESSSPFSTFTPQGVRAHHQSGIPKATAYAIIGAFAGLGLALVVIAVICFVAKRSSRQRVPAPEPIAGTAVSESSCVQIAETPPPYEISQPYLVLPPTKVDLWAWLRK